MKKVYLTPLALVISMAISGCGGGDDSSGATASESPTNSSSESISSVDNSSTSSGNTTFNSLAGTYKWPDKDNEGDEGYIVISSSGLIVNYDYAGDSYDNEGNCYWIGDTSQLSVISGNTMKVTHEDGTIEHAEYVATGDGFRLTGTDEEGPFNVTFRKVALTESDFTPEC